MRIALGGCFRELSATERACAGLVCSGVLPDPSPRSVPTTADERARRLPLPAGA